MKKLILIIGSVALLSGCVAADRLPDFEYAPIGKPVALIGVVEVRKYLRYSGQMIEEELAVKVGENGNAILLAGEGSPNEIAIYLSDKGRLDLIEGLIKIQEHGIAGNGYPLENFKYIGSDVDNQISSVSGRIVLNYGLHESGQYWVCVIALAGYDMDTAITPHLGTPEGRRDVRLELTPDAVKKLQALIERSQEVTSEPVMQQE